jgi:glycosyltransferase involved in cell wall biosynthesis
MNKVKITVAVSAYNEEHNIKKFLRSVLKQKEEGFVINSIWVFSDGSTDKTVAAARSIKSPKIKVFEYKKRIGKSDRLNTIYKSLKTEFLVQTDADVIFAHPLVIHDLIQPLILEKKVAMCGGHPEPAKGETFIENSINHTFEVYAKLRSQVRGGNNKFSVDGRLLAYKKELVKKIIVPSDMIANDLYTFFCCLSNKYQYRYVKTARVIFRSPINLRDHLKQNIRFESAALRMKKHFSPRIVDRETYIPRKILLKNLIIQFIKNPLMTSYIFVINQYCRIMSRKREGFMTAVWAMAESTKRLSRLSLLFLTQL